MIRELKSLVYERPNFMDNKTADNLLSTHGSEFDRAPSQLPKWTAQTKHWRNETVRAARADMSTPCLHHLLLKLDWDRSCFWLANSQLYYRQLGTGTKKKKEVYQIICHHFPKQQYLSHHHTQVVLGH